MSHERSIKVKPVEVIPFKIMNRDNFLFQNHPEDFPNEDAYLDYYNRQAYRCIEGYWGKDGDAGYRFMTPNLYFYVNMTKIRLEGEEGAQPTTFPICRDVDWYISYGVLACDGFSGFSDDHEHTCLRAVGKYERGEKLSVVDRYAMSRYEAQIKKPNGEYKKYIEAREYVYKTHNRRLGRPLYANECLNLILLSTRGLGKSYFVANGIIAYDYIFGRNRNIYDWINRTSTSATIVGAAAKDKSRELLDKAIITISSFENGIGYCDRIRQWHNVPDEESKGGYFFQPQMGTIDTGVIHNNPTESGKKAKDMNANKIAHVTYGQGRSSAGAGFRGKCIIEEAGLLKDFNHVHNENAGTQTQETKSFYSIYIGTGGDIAKIKEIQNAFYNPKSFSCLPYKNMFDNKSEEIGMFIPAYYVKLRNKDENGNTIMNQAIQDVEETREEKLMTARGSHLNSDSYEGHVRSYPVVPREMFRKSEGGRFSSVRADRRIEDLENGLWKKKVSIGMLSPIANNKVTWREDLEGKLKPIVRYGDENDSKDQRSAVLIYEPPVPHKPKWGDGTPPLYCISYDPVKTDNGGTSIASIIVYKGFDLLQPHGIQHGIVAEYHGRFDDVDDIHEIAIRLACHYQCGVIYESNINAFGKYIQKKYLDIWTYILHHEPVLQEKGKFSKRRTGRYGVYVTDPMISQLETYYENWVNTKVGQYEEIVGDEVIVNEEFAIDNFYSLRLLDEHVLYVREEKTDFDAISSAFLLGVWIECNTNNPFEVQQESKPVKTGIIMAEMFKKNVVRKINNPAFNW